jgi:hypothetical protein
MAMRDQYAYWHLTPRGWCRGTYKLDGGEQVATPRSPDAVMTVRYSEYAAHGASPVEYAHRVIDVPDAAAAEALARRFGPCPAGFEGPEDCPG